MQKVLHGPLGSKGVRDLFEVLNCRLADIRNGNVSRESTGPNWQKNIRSCYYQPVQIGLGSPT